VVPLYSRAWVEGLFKARAKESAQTERKSRATSSRRGGPKFRPRCVIWQGAAPERIDSGTSGRRRETSAPAIRVAGEPGPGVRLLSNGLLGPIAPAHHQAKEQHHGDKSRPTQHEPEAKVAAEPRIDIGG